MLQEKLLKYRKRTISISKLEELVGNTAQTYEQFANHIIELEQSRLLEMVQAQGRNQRTPSIAYQYRINKSVLNKDYHHELQKYRLRLNIAIHLDEYFHLDRSVWERDLPYIKKIDAYLDQQGFPIEKVPAPERSFEIVGDEKWLVEQKGSELLHRIQLWESLQILPVSDPLMFAMNPDRINQVQHLHLIVENKTTYQALLPAITNTQFSTLIYGSGNKIPKSIENFSNQYPVEGEHHFFYFGDLDHSGITIWNSLNEREPANVATPFYLACLEKRQAFGKTNQLRNKQALNAFLKYFTKRERKQICSLLDEGAYYPQEVLKTKELQRIWSEFPWKQLIYQP